MLHIRVGNMHKLKKCFDDRCVKTGAGGTPHRAVYFFGALNMPLLKCWPHHIIGDLFTAAFPIGL